MVHVATLAAYELATFLLFFTIALSFGIVAGLTIPSGMALVRQVVHSDDFGTVMGWNQVSGASFGLINPPSLFSKLKTALFSLIFIRLNAPTFSITA